MANLKDIKRRIKSVKNTQQITRAMKMVAAAKLRRAQTVLLQARPYADKIIEMLARVGEVTDLNQHQLLTDRDGKRILYIVIAADRGLCGSYNAQVNRFASELIKKNPEASVISVGTRVRDYFAKRSYNVIGEYIDVGDNIEYRQAHEIAEAVITYFLNDVVDSVKIVYTHYKNTMSRKNAVIDLLPAVPPEKREGVKVEYIFDPSPTEVLNELLPRYIATTLYRAMLESKASEQGAKMAAMDAATKNAEDMIKKLTIQKNRARQAAITREISEIVGGADALK